MAASAPSVSKPMTAYWIWLGDNRTRIAGIVGNKGSEVAKKGGELWKALSDADRQPYEKKAKAKKDEYDKFIATEEGQKALQGKKDSKAEEKAEKAKIAEAKSEKLAQKEERKNEQAAKAALKAVEKDDALKRPCSSYWLWLSDNRERIAGMVGGKPTEVSKKGGELWKVLSETDRKPYEKKAAEQKAAYDKYVASPEGAAALQAFKDAQKAAKDQFKPKEIVAEEPVAEEKKRKATDEAQPEEPPMKKGGKGRLTKINEAAKLGA